MATTLPKGPLLEEALRAYFLKAGYYVMRGVPFHYEGYDVTDIDVWLYGRSSSVSREIAIVDIKSKRTPQAIERIFWIAGLKQAVGANKAIVATTEKRPEVKDFGRKLDVTVLDGAFLAKLENKDAHLEARLSDEEFLELINNSSLNKIEGKWKSRILQSKALLGRTPSFDTAIEWLNHGRFFAEQAATRKIQTENALRCLYLLASFIAIAIDFELRELSFVETSERTNLLSEGFTYGTKGRAGMKKVVDLSLGLISEYANQGASIASQVRAKLENSLQSIPTRILGEYFSRREILGGIFQTARELEDLAMQRVFVHHKESSVEARGLLGCLLDFWGIDRMHLHIDNEAIHRLVAPSQTDGQSRV